MRNPISTRGARPLLRRIGLGAAVGLAAVLVAASAASAHVKVSGIDATRGGYGVVTFRVPSESATASTTELTVTFPSDTPFTSADTQPMAGWTATVVNKKLATPLKDDDGNEIDSYVAEVDWKADDAAAAIPPGQFQMFNVSVGAFPDKATVSFPALQYYSDGSTVNWNEATTAGGAEPEHPAPVLDLAAAPSSDAATSTPTATGHAMAGTDASSNSSSTSWTGIAGLIAGIIALILAGIALARTARNRPDQQ